MGDLILSELESDGKKGIQSILFVDKGDCNEFVI